MATGKVVVGLLALGAGFVALQSKRSDIAVDQIKPPTVGNDPPALGDGGNAPPIPVSDGVSQIAEQMKTISGHKNTPTDVSTGAYGDTGAVGGDTSTDPTTSTHLDGMGVQSTIPRNPDSAPETAPSTCTNPELCQAGTSATGDALPVAKQYVSPSYVTFAVYGENQTVTPKEESAAMESHGPSGGYVW